jgi:hypothetical protein
MAVKSFIAQAPGALGRVSKAQNLQTMSTTIVIFVMTLGLCKCSLTLEACTIKLYRSLMCRFCSKLVYFF